jgi:hypothetical protein
MDVKEIECEIVSCVRLTIDGGPVAEYLNTVMSLSILP